jgi:hypothetical protein
MTLYLLQNEGNFKSDKLYGIWNSLMRCFANDMSRQPKASEYSDACSEYIKKTNLEQNWPKDIKSHWRGKVLEQLAVSSATVHANHIETNYTKFVTRYIRYLVREKDDYNDIRNLPTKKFNMAFSVVASSMDIHLDKSISEIVNLRPKTKEAIPLDHVVWKAVERLVTMLRRDFVKKKMSLCQKSRNMYTILRVMSEYKNTLQQRWREGTPTPGIKKKQQWTFSMCPQLSWRPKHIDISSTALKDLVKKLAEQHPELKRVFDEYKTRSHDVEDDWNKNFILWNSIFNLNRVMRKKHFDDPSAKRFANFISTDGVSVSCGFQKKKSDAECAIQKMIFELSDMKKDASVDETVRQEHSLRLKEKKKEIDAWMKQKHSIESLSDVTITVNDDGTYNCETGQIIIGLDPGVRNSSTWVVHDELSQRQHMKWKISDGAEKSTETRYESGTILNGWFRFESGQKQYQKKMNKRTSTLCPEILNTPTAKTHDTEELLVSYRYQVGMIPNVLASYFGGDKWFQKQKMKQFVKKKKAIETAVSKITGTTNKESQSKIVIAHGDGDMQGTMRGVPPTMTKSLTRKLCRDTTLVFINEFKTSAKCSCCFSEMDETCFRVKRCSNSDCIRSTWNRDINAAINILNAFLHEMTNQGRKHPEFSRTCIVT